MMMVWGVTITESGGSTSVSENSGTDTYTVVLDSQPTHSVSVAVTSTGPVAFDGPDVATAYTTSETLTFTTSNWNSAQTITVQGQNDDVDNTGGSRSATLTHVVSSTDAKYNAVSDETVSVSVVDDDATPEIDLTVNPTSVAEGDGPTTVTVTATIDDATVRFDEAKTVTVAVAGSGADGVVGFAAVNNFNITINAGAASGSATFMLTPDDDSTDETNETITISGSLSGVTVNSATVTLTDDDGVGVTITESGGSTSVSENSGTDTYTVVLDSQPTHSVSVAVTSTGPVAFDGPDVATAYTTSETLTFTTSNWNSAQTITVQGQNDDVDNTGGSRSATITHAITSSDTAYNAVSDETVSVSVVDDDATPEIDLTVNPTSVAEGDGPTTVTVTATIDDATVRFDEAKTVTVAVAGSGADGVVGFVAVNNFNITINTGARSGSNTFMLTPDDDSTDETDETITISGSLSGVTVNSATVTLTDDDGVGVTITESGGSTSVSENSGTDTYTVVLDSQPTHSVSVAVTSTGPVAFDGPDVATAYTTSETLTFTTSNWNSAQTITVQGQNDDVDNTGGSRSATITHAITSSDTAYNAVSDETVSVTVTDDDATPEIDLTVNPTSVAEGDGPTTVTVTATIDDATVRFDEAKTVTVAVAGSGADGVVGFTAVNNFNITINAGAASNTGTFTLTPDDDSTDETDETITVSGASTGLTVNPVTLSLTDDDSVGVTITESDDDTTVAENAGTDSYTVVLDSQPTHSVSVAVSSTGPVAFDGPDDATAYTTSETLMFTTSNWNSAQTITVQGQNDDVDNAGGSRSATITHVVSSTDAKYNAVSDETVSVSVSDDDATSVVLTRDAGASITEGDTLGYTLTLNRALVTDELLGVPLTFSGSATRGTDYSLTCGSATGVTCRNLNSGTATVTFTGGPSASASVSITLTAETDNTVEVGGEMVDVGLGTLSAGSLAGGASATDNAGSVTINDPVLAGVAVTLAVNNSGTVTESGTLTVTATLESAAASANVTIPVRAASGGTAVAGDYSLSNSGDIAISSGSSSGTLTFTATDDRVDENNETLTLEFGTLPAGYRAGTPSSVNITINDDDTAGVTITETGTPPATSVSEDGGVDSYTVVLDTQPTHSVSVAVTSTGPVAFDGPDSATAYTTSETLTFTTSNWNSAQTITVQGQNDDVDNTGGSRSATIAHNVSSTDAKYNALADETVTVTVTDDDETPEIDLSVNPTTVDEGDGVTTVTVTATIDDVTIRFDEAKTVTVSVAGSGENGRVGFTAVNNFNVTISAGAPSGNNTFTLTPQDDSTDETDETITISGTSAGLTINSAKLTLTDDDGAGVTITQTGGSTSVSENSGTDTYTVVLDTQPTHSVSVAVTSTGPVAFDGPDVATVYTTSETLTFTTSNWSTEQTITVQGQNDNVDNTGGSRSATITHAITSDDTSYNAIANQDVTVTVTDNDATPEIDLSLNPTSVSEGGGAATVTVTATIDDATIRFDEAKTITVSVAGSGEAGRVGFTAVNNFNITISAGAPSGNNTFTLTPDDDSTDETNETITISGTSNGLTINPATLTLTDDDVLPVVTVIADDARITEGENAVFTVSASPAPAAPLTVSVMVSETSGGGRDFVASADEGRRTVTVPTSGSVQLSVATVDDDVDEPDGQVTMQVVAGTGYEPGTASQATARVAVRDNDDSPLSGYYYFRLAAYGGLREDLWICRAQRPTVADLFGPDKTDYDELTHAERIEYAEALLTPQVFPAPSGVIVEWDKDTYVVGEVATLSIKTRLGERMCRDVDFAFLAGAYAPGSNVWCDGCGPYPFEPGWINARIAMGKTETKLRFVLANPGSISYQLLWHSGLSDIDTYVGGASLPLTQISAEGSVWGPRVQAIVLPAPLEVQASQDTSYGFNWATPNEETTPTNPAALPQASIVANTKNIIEGENAGFTVTLNPAPSTVVPVTITIIRTEKNGFTAQTRTVTVPTAGKLDIPIPTIDDDTYYSNQQITVEISGIVGYTTTISTATVSIADNDNDATLDVSLAAEKTEISESNGETNFTIMLSRKLTQGESVTIPFTITGGQPSKHWNVILRDTPTNTGITRTASGTKSEIMFTAGSQTATLTLIGRPSPDTTERTITIALGANDRTPSAVGVPESLNTDSAPIQVALINDLTILLPLELSVSDAETLAGSPLEFILSLNRISSAPVVVYYATSWGLDAALDNYLDIGKSSIAAGKLSTTISLETIISTDTTDEVNERRLYLTILSVQGVAISNTGAVGIILKNPD